LKNVKTYWVSMLNPLKCVMAEYKSLIMKMHSNQDKNKYVCDNLELLCDLELILSLPCVMLILEVVHSFIKYAQCQDVFILDFLDAVNFVEAELFHLYIDPFSSFDDPLFNDFIKFL
jgi:hypothetical protein